MAPIKDRTHRVGAVQDHVRLHIVTGKGGTGKTTVAAALALALAGGGRTVLLIEVEGRQGIATLFDSPPLPYGERRVAIAPGGGEVYALAVDAEEALLEYLEMFYNLRRAGKALTKLGAVDFATTIAPGMVDVLITGKIREVVARKDKTARHYDSIVVDAPPTGRIGRFLNVTSEVAGLAKVGPIKGQSESVMRVLRSNDTAIHVVTLLEDMPVQETLDAITELHGIGLPLGAVIVNMTREPLLAPADLAAAAAGELDTAQLSAGLAEVGLAHDPATLAALSAEASEHARRVLLEADQRTLLARSRRPTYELPLLAGPIDLASLYDLAECLAEQGLVTHG